MKTLYLSDLDGTLLGSDERVSVYTASVINRFVRGGGCFSWATARSIVTASKVTAGLNTDFPVICGNGAFIFANSTHEILLSNFFTPEEVAFIREALENRSFYPTVSAYIDGRERLSYIKRHVTRAAQCYLDTRVGDPRFREVERTDELYVGSIYRINCMDTDEALSPIYDMIRADSRFSCLYQKEIYSSDFLCDILPVKATKANAALQLKALLGCDRLVVFGDERNDLSMFSVADEGYAVVNAVPELKEAATAVIGTNDSDGVAKWLEENVL